MMVLMCNIKEEKGNNDVLIEKSNCDFLIKLISCSVNSKDVF